MLAKLKYWHIKVFFQPKDHLRKKTGLKINFGKNIKVPAWTKTKQKTKICLFVALRAKSSWMTDFEWTGVKKKKQVGRSSHKLKKSFWWESCWLCRATEETTPRWTEARWVTFYPSSSSLHMLTVWLELRQQCELTRVTMLTNFCPLQGPDGDNGRDGAPGAAGLPGADVSEAHHLASDLKSKQ